jgi:hypothetical protein
MLHRNKNVGKSEAFRASTIGRQQIHEANLIIDYALHFIQILARCGPIRRNKNIY